MRISSSNSCCKSANSANSRSWSLKKNKSAGESRLDFERRCRCCRCCCCCCWCFLWVAQSETNNLMKRPSFLPKIRWFQSCVRSPILRHAKSRIFDGDFSFPIKGRSPPLGPQFPCQVFFKVEHLNWWSCVSVKYKATINISKTIVYISNIHMLYMQYDCMCIFIYATSCKDMGEKP